MWWHKREPVEPPDVQEARNMRQEATNDLAALKQQGHYVARLSTRLIERRALNHFGDEIQITFTPRSHGA